MARLLIMNYMTAARILTRWAFPIDMDISHQKLASSYPQSASITTFSGKNTRCRPTGLFTQVRGIGILGSSYPESCIAPPQYP
jgi:hypothetical protein